MPGRAPPPHQPLVLIANAQEWFARSLESILRPSGYAVLMTYTGKHALEGARRARPDAVILQADLADISGLALCREMRNDPHVTASTPILLTTSGPTSRQLTLDALRAGANGVWGQPLDTEEFLLRLDGLLRAKRDADEAREEGLVDPLTGLYNVRGLTRRARELGSQALRWQLPLACVVLAPELPEDRMGSGDVTASTNGFAAAAEVLGRALKTSGRLSDTIGRLGPTEFAVLAPHTDAAGAAKLGERLAHAAERSASETGGPGRPLKLRGGYYVLSDFTAAGFDPVELLARATSALRTSKADVGGSWIRPFEGGPRLS